MNRSLLRAAARAMQTGGPSATAAGRRYASSAVFNWEDPLAAAELYTDEELAIQETARQYCQERLMPRVLGMYLLIPVPPMSTHLSTHTQKHGRTMLIDSHLLYRGLPQRRL